MSLNTEKWFEGFEEKVEKKEKEIKKDRLQKEEKKVTDSINMFNLIPEAF